MSIKNFKKTERCPRPKVADRRTRRVCRTCTRDNSRVWGLLLALGDVGERYRCGGGGGGEPSRVRAAIIVVVVAVVSVRCRRGHRRRDRPTCPVLRARGVMLNAAATETRAQLMARASDRPTRRADRPIPTDRRRRRRGPVNEQRIPTGRVSQNLRRRRYHRRPEAITPWI